MILQVNQEFNIKNIDNFLTDRADVYQKNKTMEFFDENNNCIATWHDMQGWISENKTYEKMLSIHEIYNKVMHVLKNEDYILLSYIVNSIILSTTTTNIDENSNFIKYLKSKFSDKHKIWEYIQFE